MRTLCDVCESAAATLFCAADEAALCRACDEKVHMCNKLANRHVRVGLAAPNAVPHCDICENAPGAEPCSTVGKHVGFFYCETDGTSLCLQCDMSVHVGGKRTHGRYLLLRQRVEHPADKPLRINDPSRQQKDPGENGRQWHQPPKPRMAESQKNHKPSPDGLGKMDCDMIDLNMKPQRIHGQASTNQQQE